MKRAPLALVFALSLQAAAPSIAQDASQDLGQDLGQANKAIARRVFLEIFNQGRLDVARQIYAPDFVNHGVSRDAGLEEDQAAVRGWRQAAPDLIMSIDIALAEGDLVSVAWHGVGTNTGSGNGYNASGRRMKIRGITIWRIERGRIREEWTQFSAPTPVDQAK